LKRSHCLTKHRTDAGMAPVRRLIFATSSLNVINDEPTP
jgi:hypothetical protein